MYFNMPYNIICKLFIKKGYITNVPIIKAFIARDVSDLTTIKAIIATNR
jgi:hypothetical protein